MRAGLELARHPVSKHLAALEAANLVATARRGREKLRSLDAIAERWINQSIWLGCGSW